MARNGKIARLPLDIRDELNERLQDGGSGVELVKWLNQQAGPFLNTDAKGRRIPISEQNLSEWRSGGYQDWLRHEEARQFMEDMVEQAEDLEDAADGKSICDRFGALLAVDMARLAKKFLEQKTDDEKRWARLKEISKELSRLRRDEHRAVWTWIKRQQWEHQRERETEEAIRLEERKKHVAALFSVSRARAASEAELAQKIKSDRIKPNPTKNVARSGPDRPPAEKAERRMQNAEIGKNPGNLASINVPASGDGNIAAPETGALRPNLTKSNQNCDPNQRGHHLNAEV